MPAVFIHLSDIHFGQEKGAEIHVNNDVKEQLINDAARLVQEHAGGKATGVIVTGDIAYSGKPNEYRDAAAWLDRLVGAIGCNRTDVQVVPGNHDIDRSLISNGCQLMLDQILELGEEKLHTFLQNDIDREVLYARFNGYRPFAEGYDCPLDQTGGHASQRHVHLAEGRVLRFIGLNSALACSPKDQEGLLLLGSRQSTLPRNAGEELVVLSHHPLHWLRDTMEARRYVRSRARVFVSGHEHNPALKVDKVRDGCDVLMLAAGATVPPKDEPFGYTYNLLIFDWHESTDGLKVTVVAREWSQENTDFEADKSGLGTSEVMLGCPNFRSAIRPTQGQESSNMTRSLDREVTLVEEAGALTTEQPMMDDSYHEVLLTFFRDLSPYQRIEVFAKLKALPSDWSELLTQAVERRIFDQLASTGKLDQLKATMDELQHQIKGDV